MTKKKIAAADLMAKLNAGQKEAAKELAAADATNAARANETLDVVKTVHVLVNHENHVLLAAVADLSRYKADHSGLPEDRVAADKAATALAQHDARQAMADRAKIEMGTDEQKKGR